MQHPRIAETVNAILTQVIQWASSRTDILAVALVGSWARGTARPDSDIDFMFLTPNLASFREHLIWIDEIDWNSIGCEVEEWEDEDYGLVWSRHLYLTNEIEAEFSFGLPSWASVAPIDAGTLNVVRDGCRILYDPENLLKTLIAKVRFGTDK